MLSHSLALAKYNKTMRMNLPIATSKFQDKYTGKQWCPGDFDNRLSESSLQLPNAALLKFSHKDGLWGNRNTDAWLGPSGNFFSLFYAPEWEVVFMTWKYFWDTQCWLTILVWWPLRIVSSMTTLWQLQPHHSPESPGKSFRAPSPYLCIHISPNLESYNCNPHPLSGKPLSMPASLPLSFSVIDFHDFLGD